MDQPHTPAIAPPMQPEPPRPPAPRPPDPGSRRGALVAWLVLLVSLPVVVALQQLEAAETPEADPAAIAAPAGDQVEIAARLGARAAFSLGQGGGQFQGQVDAAVQRPVDRLRAAIAAGQLVGVDEAADRLDRLAEDFRDPEGGLAELDPAKADRLRLDAELLAGYYNELAAGADAEPLDVDTVDGFIERHGFFGELVGIAHEAPEADARERLLGGALGPLLLLFGCLVAMGLAVLSGLALGVVALVRVAGGVVPLRMERPGAGGSVYLESAVAFVVGFALLVGAQAIAGAIGSPAVEIVGLLALPAQWLLLLCPLWPLLRGVSWRRIKDDLGLRAPRGVLVEVGAGLVGYLALLPLLLVGIAVMIALLLLQEILLPGDPEAAAPVNPILELVKSLDPLTLVLFFTLATVWAPLCEELVFRGALLRHLRSRIAFLPLAAVLSALVFGLMHGYQALQLIPVTVLGFNFALLRAWRGSLIAPIVAHFLNNFVVLTMLVAMAFLLYG
ncbi:MAG: CPBP family intramembrane glutamic endopeptidase [Planctomycetota bacterium]